jgi:1,2-diacylglycerol 3-beta-galactosyltransferase
MRTTRRPVVELVVTRAGQGHLQAAAAIAELAQRQGRDWEIRQSDILELLASQDPMRRFGRPSHTLYNWMLRTGTTWLEPAMIRGTKLLVRRRWRRGLADLERHWRESAPDLVVSLVPYVNVGIRDSLSAARPGTPLMTVMLDLVDTPPDFWIEPGTSLVVCPTAHAIEQARALGVRPGCARRISGPIVHPRFYDPVTVDRATARELLGLAPNRPTGIVMFGGQGSSRMLDIAQRVEGSDLDVQLVYMCGHNARLAAALNAMPRRRPRVVLGFTDRVRDTLALGDFFVGKPGPNSLGEALVSGLPVVVDHSWRTLVQERWNAQWVRNEGLGIVVPNFREVVPAIRCLIEPGALASYRARVARLANRGVFELMEILEEALAPSAMLRAREGT